MGRVVNELLIGQQRRQKEIAAGLAIQQQRVFADPAETRELGEFALQQRRGIDDPARERSRRQFLQIVR
jgi:hypothetical protein